MPRPVVPIFFSPLASSRARSIWPCDGRIKAQFSAILRLSGVTTTPLPRMASISLRSAQGSTTTPLPMIDSFSGRTTPDGKRLSRYSTLPITSVWPALWPPWKRPTTSARCDSQSTILPLPSSPHWAPSTATLAMSEPSPRRATSRSSQRDDLVTIKPMAATEALRFGRGILHRHQPGHRGPAFGAQALGDGGIAVHGQIEAPRRRRRRQRPQYRIRIEREAGGGLAAAIAGPVAPAAAELAAHAAAEEG